MAENFVSLSIAFFAKRELQVDYTATSTQNRKNRDERAATRDERVARGDERAQKDVEARTCDRDLQGRIVWEKLYRWALRPS